MSSRGPQIASVVFGCPLFDFLSLVCFGFQAEELEMGHEITSFPSAVETSRSQLPLQSLVLRFELRGPRTLDRPMLLLAQVPYAQSGNYRRRHTST
jgi:hypothetical protein